MASKTLAGAAASFANRFFYPSISQKSNPNLFLQHSITSPYLSMFQPWRCLQEEEAVNAIKRADFAGISYHCGIPSSLLFFIEDGDDDDTPLNKPMLLLPKRTYQPSHIKRKRAHGFFAWVVGGSLRGGWQKAEQESLLNSLGWMSM